MELEDLRDKKILILGFGNEGKDTLSFLRENFPDKVLGIADQLGREELNVQNQEIIKTDKKVELFLGKNYLAAVSDYEVIFRTPGISLTKVFPYLKKDQILTSQTEFFLENCPGKIIGVTGTKGKGTTASMIHQVLEQAGRETYLVGNIGEPALSYLNRAEKEDIFIYELSAQQVQDIKVSPHIVVFLNLYQAHLDYYDSFEEYKKSKERIALFQKKDDWFIYNCDQKHGRELAHKTKAKKVSFSLESENADCFVENGWLVWRGERVIRANQVPLVGRFNLYNVMAAICAAKLLKIPNEVIERSIKEFRALAHRLEFIGEFRNIKFYNDSLATLPEPVIFTIEAFGAKLETIMLGGWDARQDFKKLARKVLESKIKNIIFFPTTGRRIYKDILKIGEKGSRWRSRAEGINHFFVDSMKEAVEIAYQKTSPEKICLLSPAAPSFGIFKNYRERGEQFIKYVKEYGQEEQEEN